MRFSKLILGALLAMAATPASAELPEGARAMIEAAIATGDEAKVATVVALARSTWPDEHAEIDALKTDFQTALAARKAEVAQAEEEAIRTAGLFERWSGEGSLGGFLSSGNTDSIGVSAALKLKREGIEWTHAIRLRSDYQRQDGATSREQWLAAYEPRWQFDDDVFAYGLAQYERDRIQGYLGRYAISGGLGYRLVNSERLKLSIKAGPAYRVTEFADGTSVSGLAGLAGLDFDWQIFDRLKLTQDVEAVAETGGAATVIIDSANTTINLTTGLDFRVTDRLRSRISYQLEYDSNPAAGAVNTDTHTRASLVYGF